MTAREERIALGRVIRRLRHDRRLSIASLASKSGVSLKHLGLIERGQTNPTVGTLLGLTGALGVTLSEVVRAAEAETGHGERRLTPEEFERHFGHLPADGEG